VCVCVCVSLGASQLFSILVRLNAFELSLYLSLSISLSLSLSLSLSPYAFLCMSLRQRLIMSLIVFPSCTAISRAYWCVLPSLPVCVCVCLLVRVSCFQFLSYVSIALACNLMWKLICFLCVLCVSALVSQCVCVCACVCVCVCVCVFASPLCALCTGFPVCP
jgi:hypothetical protein